MTDSTTFTSIAIRKETGEWKKFFSMVPGRANDLAKAWLAS